MKIVVLCLLLFFVVARSAAASTDTLRYFDPESPVFFYTYPQLALQAARFDLQRPAILHSVAISLGGEATGTITVHVYNHEGGIQAPLQEKDIVAPVVVRKSQSGYEKVVVDFDPPLHLVNNQFFIAVTDISPGITLLTDRVEKVPRCSDPVAGKYYYQAMKLDKQDWMYGLFSFLIEPVIAYDPETDAPFSRDTMAFQPGSVVAKPNIACADLDNNGYTDILAGGRLYINRAGAFEDRTISWKITDEPRAGVFIDMDNDGLMDMLFIGCNTGSALANILYHNTGSGTFVRMVLGGPGIEYPSSVSIADVNSDRYPDVFIGQYKAGGISPNYLLINTGKLDFQDASASLPEPDGACRGAGFVDINNDNRADLFIANYGGRNSLWLGNGDGTLADITADSIRSYTLGCHWADADNDGDMDGLLPAYSSPYRQLRQQPQSSVHMNETVRDIVALPSSEIFHYEEKHSGGAWGDINNDGRMDCLLATSCPCRYADVYIQNNNGSFDLMTGETGLDHLDDIHDAIWMDTDNNGLLDLVAVEDGRPVVYKQRRTSANNYVQLDVRSASGNAFGIGATVRVYAGDRMYTQQVLSGRGLLMQDPVRLHFGLEHEDRIDSVVVEWPAKEAGKETFTNIEVNRIHLLTEGYGRQITGQGNELLTMTAYPNPSNSSVAIEFDARQTGTAQLRIYDVNGSMIAELLNGSIDAGTHKILWNAVDASGSRVPSGVYLYRMSFAGREYTGRLTLID